MAAVEDGLRRVRGQEKYKARLDIVGTLRKAKPPPPNMSSSEFRAMKELRKDDSIIILQADKGKATVVMDKVEYEDKISTMLSDEATYKSIAKDPAPALERRMNSLLLSLRRSDAIT